MKTLLLISIILCSLSCSEEGFDPCNASADKCNQLLRQMEQAADPKEKEQYRQYYLAEKHFLDACRMGN